MSRDWNIIDDEPAEAPPDDDRLNTNRIRLIALERAAAHRTRQWTAAAAMLLVVASIIVFTRAFGWILIGQHRVAAIVGLVLGAAMLLIAARTTRRLMTRS